MTRWNWLYVALLLLAFGLRVAVFDYGLPYVDHVDEPNFYMLANDWRGALDARWRNDWLAGYPPAYLWTYVAALEGIDAISEPNIHTDMGLYIAHMRLLSVFLDALSLALLMTMARWLGGNAAGAIAGAAYLVSTELLTNSIIALPDPGTVFLVLLTAALTIQALRRDSVRLALLATVAALLAIAYKYPVFPVLLLPAAFFLRHLWQKRLRAIPASALALGMVGATAVYLLFVNGGANISNAEGLRARNSLLESILTLSQWERTLAALFGTIEAPLLLLGLAGGLVLLWRHTAPRRPALLALLFGTALLILAIVPGYVTKHPYPARYTWPAAALFIPVLAALFSTVLERRKWGGWGLLCAALVLLWGTPELARRIQAYHQPYTYEIAQQWFEENIPDGSVLWVEGFFNYRSLSRYDAGYAGFKEYGALYAQDFPNWEGGAGPVDYIYLAESERETWPSVASWPALSEFTLIKRIGDEAMNRETLYIYSTDPLASQQATPFRSGDVELTLRGIALRREGDTLHVPSYWQSTGSPPPHDYSYTLYLTPEDEPQTVIAQQDAGLGQRPTSTWTDSEEVLRGEIAPLQLPEGLDEGPYTLWLGIYYWETGERLLLDDGAAAYRVGQVRVPGE